MKFSFSSHTSLIPLLYSKIKYLVHNVWFTYMPINVSWLDEDKTVVLCSFEDRWTWQEYSRIEENIWDFVGCMDYRIDVFADWTQSAGFPIGVMDIINRIGDTRYPPRDDIWVMNISRSSMLKILIGAFRRLYPKVATNYYLAATLDEAIQMLEHDRGKSIVKSISPFDPILSLEECDVR